MGKNTKVMPQKTLLSIFSLWKGRESLRLQTLHKKLSKSALSALPPARKNILIQTMCGRRTPKLTTFPQISHLSSNRRVRNLTLYFQFTTPARELTHRTKFEYPERYKFWEHHVSSLPEARETPKILPRKTRILATPCFFTTLSQRNAKNPTQKDTNFSNAIILHYLRPENHQIQPQKTQILHKTALIDPSKMPRKVFVFPEIRTSF